jgi:hypothetical protein
MKRRLYFQKVLQSSKNIHRPSGQSENTKVSATKNPHKKKEMFWNLKEQATPVYASRTF